MITAADTPGTLLATRMPSSVCWRSAARALPTALGEAVGVGEVGDEVLGEGLAVAVGLGLAVSVGAGVSVGVGASVGAGEAVGLDVGVVVGAGVVGGVVHADIRASSATITRVRSRSTGSATVHRQA
jgi:hypothetical protein